MRFAYQSKVLSISFAALLLLLTSSTSLSVNLIPKKETPPQKITALTGDRMGSIENLDPQTQFSSLTNRVSSLVSEIQFLPIIFYEPKTPPNFYLEEADPELMGFIANVFNGLENEISGIFIPEVLALPVVHQPGGNSAFVSDDYETITLFSSASLQGVIGLLAHNYLSGSLFYNIQMEDIVYVVYGDGSIKRYQIDSIEQYQRLERSNLRSSFQDLLSDRIFSSDEIFERYYRGQDKITFQTCLERYGINNWGLTFTTASPIDAFPIIPVP
jgi:hypothetical protein